MNNIIKSLQNNSIKQHSKKWYSKRLGMITASDCGTILGYDESIGKCKDDIIKKKLSGNKINNVYTAHGNFYESIAQNIFQSKYKLKVFPIGLIIHKNYPYIGASPDGIVENNRLLEIKCPFVRKISGNISLKYYSQVQLQLEVTNLDYAYFYECEIKEYNTKNECINLQFSGYNKDKQNYWNLECDNLLIIERNKHWFLDNIPKLTETYNELKKEQSKVSGKKRSNSVVNNFEKTSKRQKLGPSHYSKTLEQKWLHSSKIRNYLLNDHLSDWLDIYGEKNGYQKNSNIFGNYLYNSSCKYKNKVAWLIEHKYQDWVKRIPYYYKYCLDLDKLTINYMKLGIPIIIHGIIGNSIKKEYITPDFLIRSDYFNKIFPNFSFSSNINDSSRFGNFYYIIVNTKFMKLHFTSNGKYLLNSSNIKLLKGQMAFQINLLNEVQQSFKSNIGFIIGNGYTFKSNGIKYTDKNIFNKLGVIYLDDYDNDYIEEYKKGIKWYRRLEKNGYRWKILPKPSVKDLYPFISSQNINKWNNVKKKLAHKLKEISLLWNIGKKSRDLAHKKSIYTWNDPKLLKNLEYIGFKKDSKKHDILKKIIQINKSSNKNINPLKIINNDNNWKNKNKLEFFVDFETINDSIANISIIYLIGLLIHNPNAIDMHDKFKFYSFYVDKLSEEEEYRIIEQWIHKMKTVQKNFNLKEQPNIYTWSSAEDSFINSAKKRHNKSWDVQFTDFMKIFKSEPIVIKGLLSGFGLKQIATIFYNNGLISSKYDSKCTSGDISMISAIKYYNEKKKDEMDDLIHYNYLDCLTISEIINYLRNNHI